MATEILVNDGGAPARILPFVAGVTITAGMPVMVSATTGKIEGVDASFALTGFALNAAAADEMVNVITGSGIIVRALVVTSCAIGDYCVTDAGKLERTANAGTAGATGTNSDVVAIALEANATGSDALTKVLVI